ncbi:MAG TPA: FKBP-type peptidyl-prolyl cis-trans isomerase N-terminal domain-containing protein [Candidatus Binatia bacterium]
MAVREGTRGERTSQARRIAALLVVTIGVTSVVSFAVRASTETSARAPDDSALARTSYALGYATGRDFRDALPITPDAFAQGLRDGLAGPPHDASVMSRVERFERMRQAMKALSDAELAAIAASIDENQDR